MRKSVTLLICSLLLIFLVSCKSTQADKADFNCSTLLLKTINDLNTKVDALINLSKLNRSIDKNDVADNLLFEALELTNSMPDGIDKDQSLYRAGNLRLISLNGNAAHLRCGVKITRTVNFLEYRVWAYRELIAGFGRLELTDEANDLLQEALSTIPRIRDQKEVDEGGTELEISQVLQESAGAGLTEKSIKLARKFKNPHRKDEVFRRAAVKLAEQNKYQEALKTARSLYSGKLSKNTYFAHEKIRALIDVARIATSKGKIDFAKTVLSDALMEARRSTEEEKPGHLVAVAITYAGNGQHDRSLDILKLAEESAAAIGKPSFQDAGFQNVAIGYARLGHFERAIEITERQNLGAGSLVGVAQYLLNDGQKEKALEVLSKAIQSGKKSYCNYDSYIDKIQYCYGEKAEHLLEILKDSNKINSFTEETQITAGAITTQNPNESTLKIRHKYDDYENLIGANELIEGYLTIGKYQKAIEMMNKIDSLPEKILAIASIEIQTKDLPESEKKRISEVLPCEQSSL